MTVYQWIIPALTVGVAAAATWDQSDFSLVAFIVITLVLWLALFLALLIPYLFVVLVIAMIIHCVDYWRRRRRARLEAGRSTRSTGRPAWNDATPIRRPSKAAPRRFQTVEAQAVRARFDPVRNQDRLELAGRVGRSNRHGVVGRRSESGRDFWDTVGAVVVGYAIGDWMFGSDE